MEDKCFLCDYFEEPRGHVGDKPHTVYFFCEKHGEQWRTYEGEIGVDAWLVHKDKFNI